MNGGNPKREIIDNMLMTILMIALLVFAVFLVVAVLFQSSKSKGLSGTVAGGAETFLGKGKGSKLEKILSILTIIVAIVFVALVLVVYYMQPRVPDSSSDYNAYKNLLEYFGKY